MFDRPIITIPQILFHRPCAQFRAKLRRYFSVIGDGISCDLSDDVIVDRIIESPDFADFRENLDPITWLYDHLNANIISCDTADDFQLFANFRRATAAWRSRRSELSRRRLTVARQITDFILETHDRKIWSEVDVFESAYQWFDKHNQVDSDLYCDVLVQFIRAYRTSWRNRSFVNRACITIIAHVFSVFTRRLS